MYILVEVPLERDATSTLIDLVSDTLWAHGAVGVEERAMRVIGGFTDHEGAMAAADVLGGALHTVAETTGLDAWRDHADVVDAGPFSIRPPWLEPGRGIDLVIDPGHSFGSGSHPSTRLATALLAATVEPGMRVADLGAGSGVLAIAAAHLGATVHAIDNDRGAAPAIRANAEYNGLSARITTTTADLASVEVDADVAVLNVTIDIHETVGAALQAQRIGRLIVAGILAGEQEQRCATAHGRIINDRVVEGEWVALDLDHGAAPTPS